MASDFDWEALRKKQREEYITWILILSSPLWGPLLATIIVLLQVKCTSAR